MQKMGKQGKNTAKKKAARQEAKAAEKENRELKRDLPARLDAVLAKGQEETRDINLFDSAPPEECPICLHPLSLETLYGRASSMIHPCCGKKICRGCMHASELATDNINRRKQKNKETLLSFTCAFCREPMPERNEDVVKSYQKSKSLKNGKVNHALASAYRNGAGIPKDEIKALHHYCRSAELGEYRACSCIGLHYGDAIIVEKDKHKEQFFYEIAAKKGDILARHSLGCSEWERGKYALAIRHLTISAEAGYQKSVDALTRNETRSSWEQRLCQDLEEVPGFKGRDKDRPKRCMGKNYYYIHVVLARYSNQSTKK